MGYHFEAIYMLGPENKAADALSQKSTIAEMNVISTSPY